MLGENCQAAAKIQWRRRKPRFCGRLRLELEELGALCRLARALRSLLRSSETLRGGKAPTFALSLRQTLGDRSRHFLRDRDRDGEPRRFRNCCLPHVPLAASICESTQQVPGNAKTMYMISWRQNV